MIKKKLDELSISRKEICEILQISKTTLYNWENKEHIIPMMKYIWLLKICEIDPFELLEEYIKERNETFKNVNETLKEMIEQEKKKTEELKKLNCFN